MCTVCVGAGGEGGTSTAQSTCFHTGADKLQYNGLGFEHWMIVKPTGTGRTAYQIYSHGAHYHRGFTVAVGPDRFALYTPQDPGGTVGGTGGVVADLPDWQLVRVPRPHTVHSPRRVLYLPSAHC